jgi:5-methylcytosine-specific restriction protein A
VRASGWTASVPIPGDQGTGKRRVSGYGRPARPGHDACQAGVALARIDPGAAVVDFRSPSEAQRHSPAGPWLPSLRYPARGCSPDHSPGVQPPVIPSTARRAACRNNRCTGSLMGVRQTPMSFPEEIGNALERADASPLQRAIVREVAREPQTAGELATRLGLRHFVQVNGALGALGRRIREGLSSHPEGLADGEYQWWTVLATGEKHRRGWVWSLRPEFREAAEGLGWLASSEFPFPEEAGSKDARGEGAVRSVIVNRYERDPGLRAACISEYGAKCFVCAMEMGDAYGDYAVGYIHVHHLTPLSEMRRETVVDPIRDLRPLCPNCHAAAHLRSPAFTMEELRQMRTGRRGAAEQGVAADGAARRR